MAKRKMSENSLKNLKPNTFNCREIAKKAQKKSVEKRKENQTLAQVAEEKLNKLYSDGKTFQEKSLDLMEEMVLTGILKPDDLIKLLTFLRDTSGQKPTDKQEITNTTPQIVVANQADADILKQVIDAKPN